MARARPTPELEISCREVKALLDEEAEFLFLDCREPEEYEIAHIPGTQLLPMSELMGRVSEIEPHRDQQVIVHCHHGGRSLKVATWLRHWGFVDVRSMTGGIDAWSQEIDSEIPRY